ncbi:hypothetical protein DITRI_Ditri02bG0128800 [Diplodiscus trichospermus]
MIGLRANNLTGEIPSPLGDMKNLIKLHLQLNNLIGSIPSSLGNLSSLSVLSLGQNNLKGIIPAALGRLSNLRYLFMGENKLSGSIAPLYSPSSMTLIDAALNQLSGSFPPELDVVFPNLEVLFIGFNQFTGTIPSIDYQGNDFKALVFEFMPNGSSDSWLHKQLESRYLNLAQRLEIALDVANALDYLHNGCETLIVHCDLKLTNILLDDNTVAHIGDFGLAKLMSNDTTNVGSDQTSYSMIKGTISYIAPEYDMRGAMSPEGNIFSYGILLLKMITGRKPIDDLFHNGLNPHNFCKIALPDGLKEILDFCMLKQIGEIMERISNRQRGETWECLVSFTEIGVACSAEVPGERTRIKDTVTKLQATSAMLANGRTVGRTSHQGVK